MRRLVCALLPAMLLSAAFLPARAAERSFRMVFVGDLMVHADQLAAAVGPDGAYDFRPQFRPVRPFLKGDLVIGNFETVLGGGRAYTGYPAFNSPDALAEALAWAGFQVLLLANNHISDQGPQGAERTYNLLQALGFIVTGILPPMPYTDLYPERTEEVRRPPVLRLGDIKIGLLNATYGTNAPLPKEKPGGLHINTLDRKRLAADIAWLREQDVEFITATFHWGAEYQNAPDKAQRDLADFCLKQGVDLIVGTHPHVLQPIEIRQSEGKTRCIAWSLGNFISCQRTLPRERACILQVDIARSGPGAAPELHRVRILPTWVEKTRLPDGKPFLAVHAAQDADGGAADPLRIKLAAVNADVRRFLGVSRGPDPDGFYTLYAKDQAVLSSERAPLKAE